jgi:hypothetical protein
MVVTDSLNKQTLNKLLKASVVLLILVIAVSIGLAIYFSVANKSTALNFAKNSSEAKAIEFKETITSG